MILSLNASALEINHRHVMFVNKYFASPASTKLDKLAPRPISSVAAMVRFMAIHKVCEPTLARRPPVRRGDIVTLPALTTRERGIIGGKRTHGN